MSSPSSFRLERLDIAVEPTADSLVATWRGRGDSRDGGGELDKWLTSLLERANNEKKKLEMHFEDLDFFNSSTIGAVLRVLHHAHESDVAIELVYDSARRWQSVTFEALDKAAKGGAAPSRTVIRGVMRA